MGTQRPVVFQQGVSRAFRRHARANGATPPSRQHYWLIRKLQGGRKDELASARARAAHLQRGFLLDLDKLRNIGRLGVEADGRQDPQFGVVERLAIAGCVHTGQDSHFAGVRMAVRRDSKAFWGI